jgi:molecular chaperone GrpE
MANDSGSTESGGSAGATRFTRRELEDAWRRALADLEDLRAQHARELTYEVEAERYRVCFAWLPVLDGLEGVLAERSDNEPAALIGVRAVRDQAVALLASLGFPRDDQTGVPFDPQRHEVAELVDDPAYAPGTVVKVLRPGYGRPPGRRLRPATVVLNRDDAPPGP